MFLTMVQYMLQPFTFEVYRNLRHSAFTSMAHRAYKTLHPQMMVPDRFTLEPVDVIVPTTPEEPQDLTTVLIPLAVEQYNFMTTTVTQKIPGYMRCLTLGFVGMLHSIMDCIGYISWLIHEGHDSTVDLGTFFVYKLSLQTAELFQKVYEKRITVFNRGYIGQVLQLHKTPTERASGIFYKLTGHITNLYKNYNLTKDYIILQHIIIPIEKVLNTRIPSTGSMQVYRWL